MAQNLNKYISSEFQALVKVAAPAATSKATTAVSWLAGVVSVASADHGFLVGDKVTVAGLVSDAGDLNGAVIVTATPDADTLQYAYATDPTTITTQVGTVAFTSAKDGLVGQSLVGGTSTTTAKGKAVYTIDAEDYLVVDSFGGDKGSEGALFTDGETITGRNATVVVDTVSGTASDIHITTKGIERVTVIGSRTVSEVLVAIRDFSTKQAVA